MRRETELILSDLEKLKWFGCVGHPIIAEVEVVQSWREAAQFSGDIRWENLKLRWRNELTSWLSTNHSARYQHWNDLVRELKPIFTPIVANAVDSVIFDEGIRKEVRSSVNWDILNFLMESEFSDLRTPTYYAALGLIYFDGHFPCGWDEEHPGGRMVVY